jgi:hypothetical protein
MGVPEADEINKLLESTEKSEKELLQIDSDRLLLSDSDLPTDPVFELHKALHDLSKSIEAGMSNVAPGQLTGQAALTREHISGSVKNRIRAVVRDWNRMRPLREVIKAALPDVSDDYIDHFTHVAEDIALKKNMGPLVRIGGQHASAQHDDDQRNLIEGVYVDPNAHLKVPHDSYMPDKHLLRAKNDAGQDVVLKAYKHTDPYPEHDVHLRAANFHRLAKDFFGMGKHVPVTAVFAHSKVLGGVPVQAIEFKPGRTPLESNEMWEKALKHSQESGTAHKLAIMDHILGNDDRHSANMIVGDDGHIHAIDNDYSFNYRTPAGTLGGIYPSELVSLVADHSPSKETVDWIKQKDPKQLARQMYELGLDGKSTQEAVRRLMIYQRTLSPYEPFHKAFAAARPDQPKLPEEQESA